MEKMKQRKSLWKRLRNKKGGGGGSAPSTPSASSKASPSKHPSTAGCDNKTSPTSVIGIDTNEPLFEASFHDHMQQAPPALPSSSINIKKSTSASDMPRLLSSGSTSRITSRSTSVISRGIHSSTRSSSQVSASASMPALIDPAHLDAATADAANVAEFSPAQWNFEPDENQYHDHQDDELYIYPSSNTNASPTTPGRKSYNDNPSVMMESYSSIASPTASKGANNKRPTNATVVNSGMKSIAGQTVGNSTYTTSSMTAFSSTQGENTAAFPAGAAAADGGTSMKFLQAFSGQGGSGQATTAQEEVEQQTDEEQGVEEEEAENHNATTGLSSDIAQDVNDDMEGMGFLLSEDNSHLSEQIIVQSAAAHEAKRERINSHSTDGEQSSRLTDEKDAAVQRQQIMVRRIHSQGGSSWLAEGSSNKAGNTSAAEKPATTTGGSATSRLVGAAKKKGSLTKKNKMRSRKDKTAAGSSSSSEEKDKQASLIPQGSTVEQEAQQVERRRSSKLTSTDGAVPRLASTTTLADQNTNIHTQDKDRTNVLVMKDKGGNNAEPPNQARRQSSRLKQTSNATAAAPHLYAEINVPARMPKRSRSAKSTSSRSVSLAQTDMSSLTELMFRSSSDHNNNPAIVKNGMIYAAAVASPGDWFCAGEEHVDPTTTTTASSNPDKNISAPNYEENYREENYFQYGEDEEYYLNAKGGIGVEYDSNGSGARVEGGSGNTEEDDGIIPKLSRAFSRTLCTCFDLVGVAGVSGDDVDDPSGTKSVAPSLSATLMDTVNDTAATIANLSGGKQSSSSGERGVGKVPMFSDPMEP